MMCECPHCRMGLEDELVPGCYLFGCGTIVAGDHVRQTETCLRNEVGLLVRSLKVAKDEVCRLTKLVEVEESISKNLRENFRELRRHYQGVIHGWQDGKFGQDEALRRLDALTTLDR